jgi:tripartite-type tricarboxylate transporter receptor subunit TctC
MLRRVALAILALSVFATAPSAQDYPQGPITLVVPYPAGGATDFVARLLQPKLSEALGQPVVIENRPGAGGNVGSAAALRAAPDGRTILLTTNAVMTLNPHLYSDLGFDPFKAAEPVVMTTQSALLLAAHPSLPANSLAELVAYAAKNPGKVSFGTGGAPMQIIGEMINKRGSIQMQHIPYKGAAPAINDAVGGHINAVIMQISSVTPFIQSKALKPLAVTSRQRIKTMPNVATMNETFDGIEGTNWYGVFVPAGTPKPIVDKLNAVLVKALNEPDVVEKLDKAGEQVIGGSPADLARKVQEDYARWGAFVKELPSLKVE